MSNGTASHGIDFPVGMMRRLLKVSRSGYYAWLERPEANRTKENKILSEHIQQIHADSGQTYGSPRIQAALIEKGFTPCRQRVVELMKNLNIKARRKRRFQVTTDSRHVLPIADNILNRKFTATEPDQAWVADITYIDTHQGWLYLAVVVDLFSRKVVGWSMADHMRTDLVLTLSVRLRPKPSEIFSGFPRLCFYSKLNGNSVFVKALASAFLGSFLGDVARNLPSS